MTVPCIRSADLWKDRKKLWEKHSFRSEPDTANWQLNPSRDIYSLCNCMIRVFLGMKWGNKW